MAEEALTGDARARRTRRRRRLALAGAAAASLAAINLVAGALTGRADRSLAPALEAELAPPPLVEIAPPYRAASENLRDPAPSAPDPGRLLVARVTRDGAPVSGAEVSLSDGTGFARRAESDADGTVEFADLASGPYEAWALRGDQVSRLGRAALDGEDSALVELALEPGAVVRGQVTASAPDPAPPDGAVVTLIPLDLDHAVRSVAVDAAGGFRFDAVARGRWQVEVDAPGHIALGDHTIAAGEEEVEVAIALARTGVVSGVVLDSAGRPVENATLVLRGEGRDPRAQPAQLERSLRVRWVHPLAGARHMPIRDTRRFGAAREGNRPAECGRGHCGVDVGHERGSVVHAAAAGRVGRVVPVSRGKAGKFVVLEHAAGLRSFYLHLDDIRPDLEVGMRVAAGDPIGTLGRTGVIRSAPHLHFAISVERDGRSWYVDPEPVLRQAVVLEAPRPLEHHAGRDAVPGPDAPLALAGEDAATQAPALARRPALTALRTDASGRFRALDVPPGSYVAIAFHDELAPGASAPIEVGPGLESGEVEVVLAAGVVVRGVVRARGRELAGARVVAVEGEGESARPVASALTDALGRFELRPLAGPLTLEATAPGHAPVERAVVLGRGGARPQLREENFRLESADAAIAGRVLDPSGFPARGARVLLAGGSGRLQAAAGRRALTDEHGAFEIAELPAGTYGIEIAAAGYPTLRARLRTDRRQEITLAAGGGVRLHVRDRHTRAALAGVRIEAHGPDGARLVRTSGDSGELELAALAAGRWRIRIRARGYVADERTIEVRPGSRADALDNEELVELARGATVAGVVRDRFGDRVAGARVSSGSASTTSDEDGSFRLVDVPTGAVEIAAERDGARGALHLELAPGDELVTLQIDIR